MDYKMVIPVLVSFALSVIMGPVVIPILRKLKMGQTEREEGVQSHFCLLYTSLRYLRGEWQLRSECIS